MTQPPGICPFTGKKQLTRTLARAVAKRQRQQYGERLGHFRCRCTWWHTGSSGDRMGRRRIRRAK